MLLLRRYKLHLYKYLLLKLRLVFLHFILFFYFLNYGSETWETLNNRQESRLQAAEMEFLRSISKRHRINKSKSEKQIGVEEN